jgi:hypothetical protein
MRLEPEMLPQDAALTDVGGSMYLCNQLLPLSHEAA